LQAIDLDIAVAGVESDPPIYCLIKDIHAHQTGDGSSSRQLLEKLKPRMGK
jgi:hypothetical protein